MVATMSQVVVGAPRLLAIAQLPVYEELHTNLEAAEAALEEAKRLGAALVVFPEAHLSPYFPQRRGIDAGQYRLSLDGPELTRLRRACRSLGLCALFNFYEAAPDSAMGYSTSPLIGQDGAILSLVRKMHITCSDGFFEQDYFLPGTPGVAVAATPLGNVATAICFDRHYPETYRAARTLGAHLLLIPTANTEDEPLALFDCELRVAARRERLAIAMCNRVGVEQSARFCGRSIVVNQDGRIIAQAGDAAQIVICDLGQA